MFTFQLRTFLLTIGSTLWLAAGVVADVDFQRQIRPILSDYCFQCHGPDADHREADLRLDLPEGEGDAAGVFSVVAAGDPDDSELLRRVLTDDADEQMPPPGSGKELDAAQIDLLREWIEQGAKWKQHWSLVPPVRGELPEVKDSEWSRHPIDRFILSRLEAEGLQPAATADPRTLVRRLSLDLTGLPPSPERVRRFVANPSEEAYEQLVDELLESAHFGERMAVAWLDQARYADTNGYSIDGGRQMWLWRDWVIDAYNRNLPFDQFVVEQLAGDLLPNPTAAQRIATGFNRNHMITHEGGTIPEENLVNYVADRVKTTSEVFLGLTMACAQCHDHKYDPLSRRDYYRFFAYFNSLGDRGLDGDGGRNAVPKMSTVTTLSDRQRQIEQIRGELAEIEAKLARPLASQPQWEAQARQEIADRGRDLQLHPAEIVKVTSPNRGAEYDVIDSHTVLASQSADRSVSISARFNAERVTALRLSFEPDENLPHHGLGHGNERGLPGSLLLTACLASATGIASDQVDLNQILEFTTATASAQHTDHPAIATLDPRDDNGWSPHPNNQQTQHITFQLAEPIDASKTPYVTVMLVWSGGRYGGQANLVGAKYRLWAVTGNDDGTNLPEDVQQILAIASDQRDASQSQRLQQYYSTVAPELENTRFQRANLTEQLAKLTEGDETLVMDTAAEPRATFMLERGQYDQQRDQVEPGTPASLPPLPADSPPNRLGLAQWLVQEQHPLTARVAVNRLWQLVFGAGLVSSSADFGSQGDSPSHPELLDWLAIEFVQSDWNVKQLVKSLVMSSTYRQQSWASPEDLSRDPQNRLLARGPRFRLQAEFVRDQALQVSGLMVDRIGGPSVNPYQPAGLWKEVSHFGSTPATAQVFVQDHGERLYRRSLYTYWKRTVPPPSMGIFDAPTREICTVQRSSTNTPLQALVLLNDPQFVEAARALAERTMREGGATVDERLGYAFELVVSRPPSEQESEILRRAHARELDRFRETPDAAEKLLSIGESDRDLTLPVDEHAAWTVVCQLMLNLSETITRG